MEILKRFALFLLTWEARAVLARRRPRIIAITGSVGKTTAKEAVHAALRDQVHVRSSEKSFNTEVGVPLTILGLESAWGDPLRWSLNLLRGAWLLVSRAAYPEWLIVEVGAERPGDISRLAIWLKPDVTVITGAPEIPVHVEYFNSPQDVVREKMHLARNVKQGGKLVVNGDDKRLVAQCADLRDMLVTYGFEKGNGVRGARYEVSYAEKKPTGVRFRYERDGCSVSVAIRGALGRPRAYAALAAFAVGGIAGVDPAAVAASLGRWEPPPGRMRILQGANGSVILDDTYNSSPAAVESAFDALKQVKCERRIALLGDMLELGKYSADAHREVGKRAAGVADLLWTVGFRSRATGEAALDAGLSDLSIREYERDESRRAGRELRALLQKGDVVLVKGSQAMRMEHAVKELLDHPEKADELLARQELEWRSTPYVV